MVNEYEHEEHQEDEYEARYWDTREANPFLRRCAASTDPELSPWERLVNAAQANQDMQQLITILVDEARDAGATWERVGGAFGISKQAAQRKFRKDDRSPRS